MPASLLTGAGGFVGRALAARLGHDRVALSLGAEDWTQRIDAAPMAGATIFHLAGRQSGAGSEAQYTHDNVEKSRLLAEAAVERGARRLVYLSTVKVHGEESVRAIRAGDMPAPEDAYARSKLATERVLASMAGRLDVVIVRSPLVLGPGARGNLASLLRLADTPLPLPLAAVGNRRSFVHVDDLAELLVLCAGAAPAASTYLAGHAEPYSTPSLLRGLRTALGRPARLFAVPPAALEAAFGALGQGPQIRRLTRSLEVETSAAETLGWVARRGLDESVRGLVAAWRAGA